MIVKTRFRGTCKGCGLRFDMYEYEGLEGGLYGDHHCTQISALISDPVWSSRNWTRVRNVRRVKLLGESRASLVTRSPTRR